MKNELMRLYSLLEMIAVSGNQNVKAMAESMILLENMLMRIEKEENTENKAEPL